MSLWGKRSAPAQLQAFGEPGLVSTKHGTAVNDPYKVTVSPTASPGTWTITVTATSGSVSDTPALTLTLT